MLFWRKATWRAVGPGVQDFVQDRSLILCRPDPCLRPQPSGAVLHMLCLHLPECVSPKGSGQAPLQGTASSPGMWAASAGDGGWSPRHPAVFALGGHSLERWFALGHKEWLGLV